MTRVVLVGAGYWGRNLFRVLSESRRFSWLAVVDPSVGAVELGDLTVPTYSSIDAAEQWYGGKFDACVIATPATTHATLALEALERGLHVLVEKPLATSSADGEKLCAAARAADRVLMVDHTYLYSPRVATLATVLPVLEPVEVFDSSRMHLGGPDDVSAMWDLLPHDIAIVRALVPGWAPERAELVGDAEDGWLYLYPAGRWPMVQLRFSRRSAEKDRDVSIRCGSTWVHWDDLAATAINVDGRDVPVFGRAEPLAAMVDDFADAIEGGECRHPARSSGVSAVWGLRIIEAAERSLELGQPVRIT